MTPTFVLGNINPGTVHVTFTQSVIKTWDKFHHRVDAAEDDPLCTHLIFTHSGPYLDDGRNKSVERFINDTEADILVFIDSDIEFEPDDLSYLLSHDFDKYPVISGSYRNYFGESSMSDGSPDWSPVIYYHLTPGAGSAIDLKPIGDNGWHLLPPTDDPPLLHAHCVGAGFLAITRTLLSKMSIEHGTPCPWFVEPVTQDNTHLGEDMGFCLRVLEMGYPVVVDPRIKLVHTKSIPISGKV